MCVCEREKEVKFESVTIGDENDCKGVLIYIAVFKYLTTSNCWFSSVTVV
jgi:hypothetical protein